jgi:NodT family efflux transporter outer membrane factor (OMF) lipoprotein
VTHVRNLAVALLTTALGACAVGPNYHTPKVAIPAQFAGAGETSNGTSAGSGVSGMASGNSAMPGNGSASGAPAGAPAAARAAAAVDFAAWWQALKDPELDSLITRAILSNPDVIIALDRLQAARTYEAGLVGTVLPEAEAAAGGGRGTGTDLARGRAPQSQISATNTNGLQHINEVGGFDAMWQLDIFGKYRREIEAARYDTEALRAARNSVLVSVIADVARAYVDLRGLQVRASVLAQAIGTLRESQRIVSIRYERGITNELDVTLANRELATLEAQAAPVAAQVQAAQYTIAVLLGAYPEDMVKELTPSALVPAVPGAVSAGLPVELLRRRPDVQQAERQLAAATARIGVATADLFPSLAISGSIGAQRQQAPGLTTVGEHIWSAGPAAVWPLLDFGQLDAQVEIADLQTRALLVNYKRTIQQAVREVDSDMELYSAQQVSLGKLEMALLASQRAVTLANERYERGLTDFLNVVDAERQEYDIEEQYTAAQVAAAEGFVDLFRSLGGGWQKYQSLPPIHRPEPAIIAMFQRALSRDDPLK